MRTTVAPSPTVTSVSVVSGPTVAPAATDVRPCSWVPGSRVTSWASSTSTSTQVVAGSTTVTPARIHASSTRRLSSARRTASCTRSLTPSTSCGSSVRTARTDAAVAVREADDVGEVHLALRVVPAEATERAAQHRGVEDVDRGVDLRDGALGVVGVLLLDDRDDVAGARVAHDPAVAGRVGDLGGEHRDGVAVRGVRLEQLAERGAVEQRHVARDHDDGALDLVRRRLGEARPAVGVDRDPGVRGASSTDSAH